MGTLAHPVGIGSETERGGFGTELTKEVAFGLGFGCGAGLRLCDGGWRNGGSALGHLEVAATGFAAG